MESLSQHDDNQDRKTDYLLHEDNKLEIKEESPEKDIQQKSFTNEPIPKTGASILETCKSFPVSKLKIAPKFSYCNICMECVSNDDTKEHEFCAIQRSLNQAMGKCRYCGGQYFKRSGALTNHEEMCKTLDKSKQNYRYTSIKGWSCSHCSYRVPGWFSLRKIKTHEALCKNQEDGKAKTLKKRTSICQYCGLNFGGQPHLLNLEQHQRFCKSVYQSKNQDTANIGDTSDLVQGIKTEVKAKGNEGNDLVLMPAASIDKYFVCKMCNKIFSEMKYLEKHTQLMHSEEQQSGPIYQSRNQNVANIISQTENDTPQQRGMGEFIQNPTTQPAGMKMPIDGDAQGINLNFSEICKNGIVQFIHNTNSKNTGLNTVMDGSTEDVKPDTSEGFMKEFTQGIKTEADPAKPEGKQSEPCWTTGSISNDNHVSCDKCSKLFSSKEYLDKHVKLKHPNIKTLGKISCTMCEGTFVNMIDYTHHLNVHLNT